jgi:hypothetical protein
MKKTFTILVAVLVTASVFLPRQVNAQSPEKMSYQAVIRDASDNLITDTQVGMQISILHGSASGTAVYVETQEPTTNANGLVSIEIGTGTTIDDFSAIDWANGPYFIKTETDPTGGTTYTITGTNQLLSVPYALHAKTAETVTGGISETDPVYGASVASGITGTDTTNWNNKLDSYTETDPEFMAWDKDYADLINTPDLSDTVNYLTNETDPVYGASIASGITGTDTTNWNNKLDSETDPSVPTGTQTGEMQYWDGSEWVSVAAGNQGDVLAFVNNAPMWRPAVEDGDVLNAATGKVWMDRNLGASQVATSSDDEDAYGDLYQWGRGADGHESRTSGTTSTLSNSDDPGHGDFITNDSDPYDWRDPQNDNLWQGVSGTNNPCPSGYRLPTEAEWEAERTSWSSSNSAGAFASPLKLPVAGIRSGSDGSLFGVGSYGLYWSSTVSGTNAGHLLFYSSNAYMSINDRTSGYSIRCLKD